MHSKHLASEPDSLTKFTFLQGNKVGEFARTQFQDGILIKREGTNAIQRVKKTKDLIESGQKIIFEAAFLHNNVLVEVDILDLNEKSFFEVKSAKKIKEENIKDASIQYWVLKGCGLDIDNVFLNYINEDCEYPNLDDLLISENITYEAERFTKRIPNLVNEIFDNLEKTTEPNIEPGPHCESPYTCQYKNHCWGEKNLKVHPAFSLPGIGVEKWKMLRAGADTLEKLKLYKLSKNTNRAIESKINSVRFIDALSITNELSRWKFPLLFIDFETYGPAIPYLEGATPYQAIPFQFSCHLLSDLESDPIHYEYLHIEKTDPRPQLAEKLTPILDKFNGTLVAYNKSVEEKCLKEISNFATNPSILKSAAKHVVDPLPLFRKYVYDENFGSSFSLKKVAPAILGENFNYGELETSDGMAAQLYFSKILDNPDTKNDQNLIKDLKAYCEQDTKTLMLLVKWLFSLT